MTVSFDKPLQLAVAKLLTRAVLERRVLSISHQGGARGKAHTVKFPITDLSRKVSSINLRFGCCLNDINLYE